MALAIKCVHDLPVPPHLSYVSWPVWSWGLYRIGHSVSWLDQPG